jgi:hypothetical protein
MNDSKNKTSSTVYCEVEGIWLRARINAFAHETASNDYSRKDSFWFLMAILFSLIGIFFIILSYITQNSPNKSDDYEIFGALLSLSSLEYALISIVATFVSLIVTIYSNHKRFSYLSERHRAIQNDYLYIAQRTRAAKDPTIKEEDLIALYKSLEKDFADQKSRGIEPQDKYFDKAHKRFKKIKRDKISSEAQSFNIGIDDKPETVKDKKNVNVLQFIKSYFKRNNAVLSDKLVDEAMRDGRKQAILEIAKNLKTNDVDVDTIVKSTGLTMDDVLSL